MSEPLTKEHYIYEFVKDRDAKALGKYYQEYLLGVLADNQLIDLTLIAIGDDTVVTGAVTETDREQRHQACLEIGRTMAQEFGEEKILYLLTVAPTVSCAEDSEFTPNTDPYRKEGAMTHIMCLEELHEAEDMSAYMAALKTFKHYVWSAQHHEGLVTAWQWEGATVQSTENAPDYEPAEGEVVAVLDDFCQRNCFVGLCNQFEVMNDFVKDKDQSTIDAALREVAKENGQVIKRNLPEVIVVSELSEESQDILEHFGLEAPALLNNFAISVEDAVIEQVGKNLELRKKYEALLAKMGEA
ncbi:hypothetical protein [Synechococcus sp. ROS8604]|uniref:hypothetical protein n=1 Tax=Synechococcus sp. ROS8604 TaxID=1442557 RepID=UPI00164972C9|nr:hypothetical protein [Synechococcus sp. ROS8604]